MSLHFISAENIRKPLQGILDSIIAQHISHRLVDDFLILTPDEVSAQDIRELLLRDSRLGSVLTGQSVLSLKQWIEKSSDEIHPDTRIAPLPIQEALFKHILTTTLPLSLSHLSSESLFLLIQSFRNEFLPSSSLLHFLEAFDPDLAHSCVQCFEKYAIQIDEKPYLKDFVWQAGKLLENLSLKKNRFLENIRRIYYLGFVDFSPLFKKHVLALEKFYPSIEQLILCQKPSGMETQDYFSKHWGEIPKNLHEFRDSSAAKKMERTEYNTAFDEISDIIRKIICLLREGKSASSIAVFLPPDDFLKSHLENQLFKVVLHPAGQNKKRLDCSSILQKTFSLSTPEALEYANKLLLEKRKGLLAERKNLLFGEIHGLETWVEVLEELLFYEEEYPEFKEHLPSLPQIAHQSFLKSRQASHEGIQIRSLTQAGLLEFDTSFIPHLTDDLVPQNTERFFGFHLPLFERQLFHQQALFQHLLNAGNKILISNPKSGWQAQEKTASSFIAALPLQNENKSCRPLWVTKHSISDIQERLNVELRRQKDLDYQHPHGGWIQNANSLHLLRKWIQQKNFSASRLEKYAACPFTFFADTLLGIEIDEEKNLEGDVREQGKWVHQLLEMFFSKNLSLLKKAGGNPDLRQELYRRLQSETETLSQKFLGEKSWIHPRLFGDFSRRVMESSQEILSLFWRQWDEKKSENPFIPRFFEKEFGTDSPLFLQKPGLPPLHLKGRIDRIDVSEDGKQFITWDYKTGGLQSFSSEVKTFKKLQLPLYLLAAEKMKELSGAEPIASLVMGLHEMSCNQGIAKKEKAKDLGLRGNSSCLMDENSWESFRKEFGEKLLDYFEKIYQGDFRTAPDPCSEFCEYRNICRYHERKKA